MNQQSTHWVGVPIPPGLFRVLESIATQRKCTVHDVMLELVLTGLDGTKRYLTNRKKGAECQKKML